MSAALVADHTRMNSGATKRMSVQTDCLRTHVQGSRLAHSVPSASVDIRLVACEFIRRWATGSSCEPPMPRQISSTESPIVKCALRLLCESPARRAALFVKRKRNDRFDPDAVNVPRRGSCGWGAVRSGECFRICIDLRRPALIAVRLGGSLERGSIGHPFGRAFKHHVHAFETDRNRAGRV